MCKRSQVLLLYACGPGHKVRQPLLMDLLARGKLGLLKQPSLLQESVCESPPERERKNPKGKGVSEKTSKYKKENVSELIISKSSVYLWNAIRLCYTMVVILA